MAEYLIQDSSLTGIAGGIRTLTGKTAKLSPGGMKTELSTLNTYVTNALNAVKNKGVTVSSTKKLKDLATLINSIEAGVPEGVGELFGYTIASGTITPTTDTYEPITVTTKIKPGKTTIKGDVFLHFHDSAVASTRTMNTSFFWSILIQNVTAVSNAGSIKNYGVAGYDNNGTKTHYLQESQLGTISVNSDGYVQIAIYASSTGSTKVGFKAGFRYRWLYIRRGLGE